MKTGGTGVTTSYMPNRNDVLCGRGTGFINHVGNRRYRSLISDCLPKYNSSNKEQKTRIAEEIVQIIYEAGGQFLKKIDTKQKGGSGAVSWIPVTDRTTLVRKVSHTFRNIRLQKQTEK